MHAPHALPCATAPLAPQAGAPTPAQLPEGATADPLARELAHLNTSMDHLYYNLKSKKMPTIGAKHSNLAMSLKLIPLYPTDANTPRWHRPRHAWCASAAYQAHGGKGAGKPNAAAHTKVGVAGCARAPALLVYC